MNKSDGAQAAWLRQYLPNSSTVSNEKDFETSGTKLQIVKVKPGGKIAPHYHKVRTEAFCVLKGSGVITQNEKRIVCSERDYVLCPPGTVHAFENNSDSNFIIVIFKTNDTGNADTVWLTDQTMSK